MSGSAEYDDQLDYYEGETQAQLIARRTRRRRRHGKKQGASEGGFDDGRGCWKAPPSGTTLTLAQLGIHLPEKKDSASLTLEHLGIHLPPPAAPPKPAAHDYRRNVVTWSDLNLVHGIPQTSPSAGPGAAAQHSQAQRPPPPPPSTVPSWPSVEDRSWDRILSVPSPQVAVGLDGSVSMAHYPVVHPRHHRQVHQQVHQQVHHQPVVHQQVHQHTHMAAVHHQQQTVPGIWNTEPDPAMNHWLCTGQYGTQPIFEASGDASGRLWPQPSPICDGNGVPLVAAPPPSTVSVEDLGLFDCVGEAQTEMEPPSTEDAKLETLLQNLAAEAYQD